MDWVNWITWTAQGIMWGIIVLFFYMIVLAMHSADKRDRDTDAQVLYATMDMLREDRQKASS